MSPAWPPPEAVVDLPRSPHGSRVLCGEAERPQWLEAPTQPTGG